MTLTAMLTAAVLAQQPAERFRVTVGQNAITGTEEFRIERTMQGTRITGTLRNNRSGTTVNGGEEETLDAAGGLVRYRLEVTVAGMVQIIEAWRAGDTVRMRGSAGGQSREQAAPFATRSLVLDNLVVSHFQVLLDRFAQQPPSTAGGGRGAREWQLYVPQVLAAVRATVSGPTADRGTLDGRPVALRAYALDAAGTLVTVWAEAASNRLMRVVVPIQQVEIVREGFAPVAAAPPAVTAPPAFVERPIRVSDGGVSLPGTVCAPAGAPGVGAGGGGRGKSPIVVLVQGSGPNDRDETIGPNKPFADLAHGLAAAGIATLRYDKRTFALRGRLDARTITVDQEVIDDAVAAVALARTLPEVDSARVYLAGHSLGGTLAPLIAARAPAGSLRGLILLAPGARPLDAAVVEQITMRLRLAGQAPHEIALQVQALKDSFARVRTGEAPDSEVVFFAPARYWRDLFSRQPLETLAALPLPVLVLQGGKDYQVTRADYDLVAAALAGRPAAQRELRWFPDLDHLFLAVAGESTGAEYGVPGHVDPRVVAAIAEWIRP